MSDAAGFGLSVLQERGFEIPGAGATLLAARPYWRVKRVFDAIAASSCL